MWIVARIVAAGLLIWALDRHPYGYFTLLRWVTCAVAAFTAVQIHTIDEKQKIWLWVFGIIAILFNPIIPVHLSRDIWGPIDLVTAGIMLASILKFRKPVLE